MSDAPQKPSLKLTYTLIVLIGVCYGATLMPQLGQTDLQPDEAMLKTFAFYGPDFMAGAWWQIITSNLLHASWMHLGSNALGLYVFGQLLEPTLGGKRLLILSLLAAVLSDLFTMWFGHFPTIGISGVVYGWMATYLTIVIWVEGALDKKSLFKNLRTLIGWGLALYLSEYMDPSHRVNHWGHLGGAVTGIMYGSVLAVPLLKKLQTIQSQAIPPEITNTSV